MAGHGLSPRRLAVEAAVVVSSLVGVYLLRRRGLADANGFDPYLAAVPLLLGLAAGIVAVRLYPLPVRFLAAAAARRRDLVPALALRRVARQPGVTAAPLLVLLLGVSVSVFAAVMAATLSHAQEGAGSAVLSPLATGTLDAFRAGRRARRRLRCFRDRAGAAPHREVPAARPGLPARARPLAPAGGRA